MTLGQLVARLCSVAQPSTAELMVACETNLDCVHPIDVVRVLPDGRLLIEVNTKHAIHIVAPEEHA